VNKRILNIIKKTAIAVVIARLIIVVVVIISGVHGGRWY